jgi:polysaccharide deacetylase family protein (PEP-CTERM system associated)
VVHNALTIDLEDWYHPELVRPRLGPDEPKPQIDQSAQALLELLHSRGVQATFFIVGDVASKAPDLVRRIAEAGHEVACHGMSHRPLWKMTPNEFRQELTDFGRLMAAILPGYRLEGYRAPTFSLDNSTRWALTVLREMGYHYDSSVFPLRTPLYGVAGGPLEPYFPSPDNVAAADHGASSRSSAGQASNPVLEFPMSVWSWAGLRVPVSGGVYLRALPMRMITWCLRQISKHRPFVVYVHPWEAYPLTPRLALPLPSRLATYYNTRAVLPRLSALLDQFSFAPMRTVVSELEA